MTGVLNDTAILKSADETTYLQSGITCPGKIKKIQCNFRIVSDEGTGWLGR